MILRHCKAEGLFKAEAVISTPQSARIEVGDQWLLNFCANNYLGLADHPAMIAAAQQALDRWGYGMASVRFICGTPKSTKSWKAVSRSFLGTEDAILYSSCFDANGGLFETLLGPEDAVISDELNHASIIDGVRLCKAHSLALRQQRHGRPRSETARVGGCAAPTHRHRRGLLHGWLCCAARRHRRARRALSSAGHGG